MPELTAEQIAQLAFDLDILDERQLNEIWGHFGRRNVPAEQFVQFVLRRELMTNFQLDRMLKGDRSGYFYGDYKVLYMVAGGSFARVYRALHKDTGVIRALKVLRKRYSHEPEQTEHFCREGMVGMKLRHPNIVPVFEVYSKAATHFLVMEFVEGRNLREFLKTRKKLDPVEATRLMIDVASGLKYAAEHGVLHRDLKLTNILISSKGQAKLVDFGLAATDSAMSDASITDALNQRTIDYAGLERATGVRKDDARSDLYFMGCMYYHMLVGRPPLFETRDRIQRLSRSRFVEVVPIHQADPSVPRVVAAVVNQAMHLDPFRRHQTPAQLLADLTIVAERLAAGDDAAAPEERSDGGEADPWSVDRERPASAADVHARRSLMFVESNAKMQDLFRDALKKAGYRVLLTSDPQRALSRFQDKKKAAECVVFSTNRLGEPALEAFSEFAAGEQTSHIPAVLLLDASHRDWKSKVREHLSEHRVVLTMPIKLKQFLAVVARLLPPTVAA
ncbi:MAG: serine/threonine-protein kinase [Pirellulales bacterium]